MGQRIAELRRALSRVRGERITQQALAAATGVSKGTVANWETGIQLPSGDNLVRLGRALEASPSYILSGEEQRWTGHDTDHEGRAMAMYVTVRCEPAEYYRFRLERQLREPDAYFPPVEDAPGDHASYVASFLGMIGGPGKEEGRKLDALDGFRRALTTLGKVPEWWYQLRDQVTRGEI